MIWFVFLFCLLFKRAVQQELDMTQCKQQTKQNKSATGGWVMPGLVSQWFPLCEFSLFDTPRVSSLVVQGLRVSAPSPKLQGLIQSFAWVYIFFSAGQILLSTLSWCSACTSASEGVFLMYPWREIYPVSTYSFVILFSAFVALIQKRNLISPTSQHCVDFMTSLRKKIFLTILTIYSLNSHHQSPFL